MHNIPYSFMSNYVIKIPIQICSLIEGSGDQFDLLSAQPSSSHSVPVRAPVVTRSCTAVERREAGAQFSPDQTGNPLRPKPSPWAVPVLALEDRRIPLHLILTSFLYGFNLMLILMIID
ncbi:hypothetical protein GQ457_17G010030 [Hibiscus cannabinus]